MKKKTVKKFTCDDCDMILITKEFSSQRGLSLHKAKVHPYIPPPPPKQTIECVPYDLDEELNLINGRNLEVGDVFYHHKKLVVLKITKTEGSNTVKVIAKVTKRHWESK